MNKTIYNLKNGNYEIVDNQGVSVTEHFTQCLEQEFADLEAKLAESEKLKDDAFYNYAWLNQELSNIKQQLAQKDQRIAELEEQLAEMNKKALALFSVLYEIIEKEDPENVSSKIDYLTRQNNSALSDTYKEEKFLKGIKND